MACDMTRGWTMFMTMNQPMPITINVGSATSGLVSTATMTGGAHETNGPKNGIDWRTPDSAADAGRKSSPKSRCAKAATPA